MTDGGTVGTSQPVVATKFHLPRSRGSLVPRDRLLLRLGQASRAALVLVSAPAGFGKTTLLSQWIRAIDRPVAWLSLDAADNDPSRFWLHLRTAVGDPRAAVGGDPSGYDGVAALIEHLDERGRGTVIVLDDFHVVESPQIHEPLGYLIERLPPDVQVAIGSRADPPLPLARLRARGELVELRAADLRFSPPETSEYLNGAMGLDIGPADVERLGRRTEGWIAALQLAALSLDGREDAAAFIDSFSGDDRFVVDFLAEEVLDRLSAERRAFLLRTSILERLGGSLCDAVTETTGGKATLESLERSNLFVIPLDDHRRWYRYHHLFADVLRARLLDEEPALVGVLHGRASVWFEDQGETGAAVEHALRGHDAARAARLIEITAPELRRARQEVTLRRWLEALPESVFADRPVLSIALVGARMAAGDTGGVEALVDRVERQLDPAGAAPVVVFDQHEYERLPAQTAVYRAGLALLAGDAAATVAHAERARSSAAPADHLCLGSAAALTGLARWATGQLGDADARYAEAIDQLRRAGHLTDVLGCSLGLADIRVARGRLRDATEVHRLALELAATHGLTRGTADLHVGVAALLIEQDRLDEAERELAVAAAAGEPAGLPQFPYRSRVAAAQLALAHGELDEADGLLGEAADRYDTDYSPPTHPVVARRACVDLLRGDLARAERWARDAGLTPDDEPSYVREFEHLTLARLLVAQHHRSPRAHDLRGAVELTRRLLQAAEEGDRPGSVIEILVVLAAAHAANGDRSAASDELERALALAAPEGRVRVFLDVVPELTPVLRSMALSGPAERLRHRIVASRSVTRPAAASARAVELSSRERDVLRLLRSDLSGPEIARHLHVSLNTLRTHTKSIYTKLGATNRREAVRLATEHGV